MKQIIAIALHPVTVQRAVIAAVSLTVLLFVAYVYFVSSSITQVVIRKEISRDMVHLNTEIAALEAKYIDAQHQVSQTIASLDGFTPVENKIFIDRGTDALVLSEINP